MTSKGQITISKAIREELKLSEGDQLEFILYPDGTLGLIPKTYNMSDLPKILPKPNTNLTLEQMDEIIAQAGASDWG